MCFLPASRAWRLHPPWGCANCTPTLRLLSLLHLKALQRGRSSSLRNSLSICKSLKLPIPRKMDLDKGCSKLLAKAVTSFSRLPLHIFCNRKIEDPFRVLLHYWWCAAFKRNCFCKNDGLLPPLLLLLSSSRKWRLLSSTAGILNFWIWKSDELLSYTVFNNTFLK